MCCFCRTNFTSHHGDTGAAADAAADGDTHRREPVLVLRGGVAGMHLVLDTVVQGGYMARASSRLDKELAGKELAAGSGCHHMLLVRTAHG